MAEKFPSIFNDVLGPIMTGPSSSHTAGPARIGLLAGQLIAGPVLRAEIEFARDGSFAATYRGQKSDQGFAAGLLGWGPDDPRLGLALELADTNGLEINFSVRDRAAPHPNTATLTLHGREGQRISCRGLSLGGGMVQIDRVNGLPVAIAGDYHELLVFTDCSGPERRASLADILRERGGGFEKIDEIRQGGAGLINVKTRTPFDAAALQALRELPWARGVRQLAPCLPILSAGSGRVPFASAAGLLAYCREQGLSLGQAAVDYEAARGGISRGEVLEMASDIAAAMRRSMEAGLRGGFAMRGFLTPTAARLERAAREGAFLPTGILDLATARAVAIMEHNSAMGVVVAAPTAGSCAALPAVFFTAVEQLQRSEQQALEALLAGGIVGVLIAAQATFAAEVCGCQAECGAAACMAAAALAALMNGTPEQCLTAASIALQNMLGLICDPVAEQVEVPCISRNVAAAANAAIAANLALNGFDPAIPLDEVIQAMWEVGNLLPAELRCTGKGGLCTTPTGLRLKTEVDARNSSKRPPDQP